MPNYTIQAGDTFSSIASKFNTTVALIEAANPGVNPNNLQIGQVINLPGAPSGGNQYTIQRGDTFTSIAAKLGTSVQAIEAANPGVNPSTLQIGQVINLPGSTPAVVPPAPSQVTPAPSQNTYTIRPGDTFTSIAAKLGISVQAIEAANPGVNPLTLQIGQVINLSGSPPAVVTPTPGQSQNKYTIRAGDTFTSIAAKLGISVQDIEAANPGVNPNTLQIGQVINLPGSPPAVVTPTPGQSQNKYTIRAGDTFTSIGARFGISVQAIEAANPGVNPLTLQIGQVINLPGTTPVIVTIPNGGGGQPGGGYVAYSGPASSFPDPSTWADYSSLWSKNSSLMSGNDSPSEVSFIGQSIQQVASESGFDARAILCIIMQESGGNVRVGTTFSPDGVRNAGLMQSHDGVAFDPNNPGGSILQMIRDGTRGTPAGDGLVQCLARQGNYYAAFRNYNSGSVDPNNLSNGLGATNDYVSKVANRLQGHVWAGM